MSLPETASSRHSDILDRLDDVVASGGGHVARCPAHEDHRASLSVGKGDDGKVLLKCHAGCAYSDIIAALGVTKSERRPATATKAKAKPKIAATYDYTNEHGALLSQVVRMFPKDFRQRRPDGHGGWSWKLGDVRRVVYGLHLLRGAAEVYAVEGERDVHRLREAGLTATCNAGGAGKWIDDYTTQLVAAGINSVVVLPDNDEPGRKHAAQVAASCAAAGLTVKVVELPDLADKGDVSDYLQTHPLDSLTTLVAAAPVWTSGGTTSPTTAAATMVDSPTELGFSEPLTVDVQGLSPLQAVCKVFLRWLGIEYDLDVLLIVLATAAAEQLDGDPTWLMLIAGPGFAKTETVQALQGAGALVTSTITSEGALLSATSKKDKAQDATGGLLRRIGARGILVIKDVTSLLSMGRDARASVMAALREVFDGRWERNVGTDGGRSLAWRGRLVCIGACTTVWDRAHEAISAMGDRFVLVRMDSNKHRLNAGRQAIRNTGSEVEMRSDLCRAVHDVMAGVSPAAVITLTTDEEERILAAADVVTRARTGVDYDYRGSVIDAHAPEAPTRFAKQLTQIVRGAVAIGVDRAKALELAIRCARDSMPPLRLAIIDDVAKHPRSATHEVRKRLEKPRATVDRQLQALHILGVLTCEEQEISHHGEEVTRWRYQLDDAIDPNVLASISVPEKSPHTHKDTEEGPTEGSEPYTVCIPTIISGTETTAGNTERVRL